MVEPNQELELSTAPTCRQPATPSVSEALAAGRRSDEGFEDPVRGRLLHKLEANSWAGLTRLAVKPSAPLASEATSLPQRSTRISSRAMG